MFKSEINLKKYKLSELNLDNLASEFYGKVLAVVGTESNVEVLFEEKSHKDEFEAALKCFEVS